MAIIGTFNRDDDSYTGTIATLALKAKTTIKPVQKGSEQSPDFRVYAAGAEIGAGWSATGKTGKPYLSLRLDDPSFASPIHCRLVGLDEPSQTLIWSR